MLSTYPVNVKFSIAFKNWSECVVSFFLVGLSIEVFKSRIGWVIKVVWILKYHKISVILATNEATIGEKKICSAIHKNDLEILKTGEI